MGRFRTVRIPGPEDGVSMATGGWAQAKVGLPYPSPRGSFSPVSSPTPSPPRRGPLADPSPLPCSCALCTPLT